jgi:hypothetical protein
MSTAAYAFLLKVCKLPFMRCSIGTRGAPAMSVLLCCTADVSNGGIR